MVEKVELTADERALIDALSDHANQGTARALDAVVRSIVRQEIASLAGKALRRTQDQDLSRSPDRNMMTEIANRELAQFWGEVLAEYGGGDA